MTTSASTLSPVRRPWGYASLETTDADQHSSAMSGTEHSYEQVKRGPFRGKIAELLLDPVHIVRDQVFNPIGYSGPARVGWHIFFSFLPTAGTVFFQGRQIGENTVLKYPRDFPLRAFCTGPIDCVAISIRGDAVAEEVAALTGRWVAPESFQQALCVANPEMVARFQSDAIDALAHVAEDPRVVDDDAWRGSVTRNLVDLLLDIVEAGAPAERELPRPITRAYVVDKAIEYLHANLSSLPVLSDVCKHVRVSPRTLRYSFEQVVGVSPAHYLLSLRLRRVRAELLEGGGSIGVYRIAQRFGFCHMGRFALFYQQAFGERPSDTCRRAASASRPQTRGARRSAARSTVLS